MEKEQSYHKNYLVIYIIIGFPLIFGVVYERYKYLQFSKKYKQPKETSWSIFKRHLNELFENSIFKYLELEFAAKNEKIEDQQETDDKQIVNSEQLKSDIKEKLLDPREGDSSCQNRKNSERSRIQITVQIGDDPSDDSSNQSPALEKMGENNKIHSKKSEDEDKDDQTDDEIDYLDRLLSKHKRKIYFLIVISNIMNVPLIYSVPLMFSLKNYLLNYQTDYGLITYDNDDYHIRCILSSIIILLLYFLLNFCMFLYASIITGQGVLLLISLRFKNKEKDIRLFLKSCFIRSFYYSILFLCLQTFFYVQKCAQSQCSPEEFQKYPLILVIRYLASLFISMKMKKTYSNQTVFKKKRLFSLYQKFYNKYFHEKKLEEDFNLMKKNTQFQNENELRKIFLIQRESQARRYYKKMEDNLINNKKFKLDNILTNKHMKIQVYLTLLYTWLFVISPLILLGIALYFFYYSIPQTFFDYYSSTSYIISGDSENINILDSVKTLGYYINNKIYEFKFLGERVDNASYFLSSDSSGLFAFNIVIVIQAISMVFIRFQFQTNWILNENSHNRFKQGFSFY